MLILLVNWSFYFLLASLSMLPAFGFGAGKFWVLESNISLNVAIYFRNQYPDSCWHHMLFVWFWCLWYRRMLWELMFLAWFNLYQLQGKGKGQGLS